MLLQLRIVHLVVLLTMVHHVESGKRIVNSRVGEDVDMKCARSGENILFYWYKDNIPITEHSDLRMRDDVLMVKNVRHTDQGLYSCRRIGGFGAHPWKNFSLFVYDADVVTFPENPVLETITQAPIAPVVVPRFLENPPGPRELTLKVASSARLGCAVQAEAGADIDWYKDNRLLDYQRENVVMEGYTIRLNSLRATDAGRYTCKVYNAHGTVNFTYHLSVTDTASIAATVVLPYPQNTSVTYGSTTSLQCKVRSYVSPTIMWLKRVPQKPDDRPHIRLKGKLYVLIKNETMMIKTEEGAYLNKLVLYNVRMEDAGVYVCLGLNPRGGSDYREALVTVIGPPAMTTSTEYPAATDNSWEYLFGSPSATLAVLIAIPTLFIIIVTVAIVVGVNRRNKNAGMRRRRRPSNMLSDHCEVAVPLNMNVNNGCYSGQHSGGGGGGSTGSYSKVPFSNGDMRYAAEKNRAHSYNRCPTPQQYTQYMQSDGSYRSTLQYPPVVPQDSYIDNGDSDSHFSSVSHTHHQYMGSRNPYDDRDIRSDPPASRVGGHHCPPPPPGSYYSGQW